MTSFYSLQLYSYQLPAFTVITGHWLLVTGYWLLSYKLCSLGQHSLAPAGGAGSARYRLFRARRKFALVTGHWLLVTGHC